MALVGSIGPRVAESAVLIESGAGCSFTLIFAGIILLTFSTDIKAGSGRSEVRNSVAGNTKSGIKAVKTILWALKTRTRLVELVSDIIWIESRSTLTIIENGVEYQMEVG